MRARAERTRRLSADERELWRDVTRGVKPIRPEVAETVEPASRPDTAPLPGAALPPSALEMARKERPRPSAPPPLAELGKRLKGRVARGSEPIDGRLDLHGLTQAEAHDAVLGFLRRAQARHAKLVLVITGKGMRGGGSSASFDGERGVLRHLVPRWLAMPEFRAFVVAFETAHTTHGGEGALYVRLRRARER